MEEIAKFEERLKGNQRFAVKPNGFSMGAHFAKVDSFLVQPLRDKVPELGRLILFNNGRQWVVHRLVYKSVKGDNIILHLKGDSNWYLDKRMSFKPDSLAEVTAIVIDKDIKDALSGAYVLRSKLALLKAYMILPFFILVRKLRA